MSIFFRISDARINFSDPTTLVRDQHSATFGRRELAPYIMSELCTLDMIYAVATMKGGYYREGLVLKGGLSVRNHVPLTDHRFSFDADYDPNTQFEYSFGKVDGIRKDLLEFGSRRGCRTRVDVTKDSNMLYFLELGYKKPILEEGIKLIEAPKLELCKTCRVLQAPQKAALNTFIDLGQLGLEPLEVYHVGLEEQLATKLFIIGSSGRQRNQFDAYDAMRIVESNKLDWKRAKSIFEEKAERAKTKPKDYIEECRRQLDTMMLNDNKKRSLEETTFKEFNFGEMVQKVKAMYNFRG